METLSCDKQQTVAKLKLSIHNEARKHDDHISRVTRTLMRLSSGDVYRQMRISAASSEQ